MKVFDPSPIVANFGLVGIVSDFANTARSHVDVPVSARRVRGKCQNGRANRQARRGLGRTCHAAVLLGARPGIRERLDIALVGAGAVVLELKR
jgi:hypothetical protein